MKGNLFLPKLIRDSLNVIYWFSIIFLVFYFIIIFYTILTNDHVASKIIASSLYPFPVEINIKNSKLLENLESEFISLMNFNSLVFSKNPTNSFAIYSFSVYVFSYIVFILIIYQLRKIFKNISTENYFANNNSKLISNIGLLIIFGSLFQSILSYLGSKYIVENIKVNGISLSTDTDFNLSIFLIGFIVLALSQVFRFGKKLKDEQDLTI